MALNQDDLRRIGEIVALKIEQAVGPIRERLAEGSKDFEFHGERFDAHESRLNRHERTIYGDGTDKEPGMEKNLNRVLERSNLWTRVTWLLLGALSTGLVTLAVNRILHP